MDASRTLSPCGTAQTLPLRFADSFPKATLWCEHATSVSDKPWYYVLIPHDAIDASVTFSALVSRCRFQAPNLN